ncbi:IclR family transcriptional regulator C-terminal domain-containing protein [Streptomyces sp. NPDC002580]|uniref:IclR family transcriptional regulator domain-containing protein n=1 Tax=Streptomyces sp. NPDC002580 TaxID=3364653 RepID=UPI003679E1B3
MAPDITPSDITASHVTPSDAEPLIRGIAVLRRLTEADGVSSLSGLERATGLTRSTLDRITATLARLGYVRLDGSDALLAPRLMELGNAYLAALRIPRLLDAYADALADELDESVSLAVGDRDGIRFIHQATRRRAMSLSFRIGDLLPAERTAPGPLFASDWSEEEWAHWRERRAADPEDRGFPVPARSRPYEGGTADATLPAGQLPTVGDDFEQRAAEAGEAGWALDDQLIEPGLVAVSMPVREAGRITCVVSVVSHTSRHSATDLRDTLLPRLRTAVAEMERVLSLEERRAPERTAPEQEAPEQEASERVDTGRAAQDGLGLAGRTGASEQAPGREFIESLARGLTVITAFGEGRSELTPTAAARAAGLARAAAHSALITLDHLGYVTTHDGAFRLTPRVLGLGFPPLARTSLPEIAAPYMAELSQRLHDSVSLAVLTGDEIQYTGRVSIRRVMSVNVTVGTRLPAYATSLGRVLLADLPESRATEGLAPEPPGNPSGGPRGNLPSGPPGDLSSGPRGDLSAALPERLSPLTPLTVTDPERFRAELDRVRKSGYSMVEEELEQGLRSIAVPVRDRDGRVVAALNVATHSSRRTAEACVRDVLPELHATATRIEADLHVASRFRRVPPS